MYKRPRVAFLGTISEERFQEILRESKREFSEEMSKIEARSKEADARLAADREKLVNFKRIFVALIKKHISREALQANFAVV